MTTSTSTTGYIQKGGVTNPLRVPTLQAVIRSLQLPLGSRGLDAGCGLGFQAMLLAEAVGPSGHITGLDISPEFLVHAGQMVKQAGLSARISFQEGSVTQLPFEGNTFDWAWSADCVGYVPLEPIPLVKELARVVKPGGKVVILAWSSEKLIPGYPILEARLNATKAGIAPFMKGKDPELHFLQALGWFRELGMTDIAAHTFVGDVFAPLQHDIRNALVELFQMRWPGMESELAAEDWAEYQRLCLPESPDFVLDHPNYYAFFTYSMFQGKVTV